MVVLAADVVFDTAPVTEPTADDAAFLATPVAAVSDPPMFVAEPMAFLTAEMSPMFGTDGTKAATFGKDIDGILGNDGIFGTILANEGFISDIILLTSTAPVTDDFRPAKPSFGSGKEPRVSDFILSAGDAIDGSDGADGKEMFGASNFGSFTDAPKPFVDGIELFTTDVAVGIDGAEIDGTEIDGTECIGMDMFILGLLQVVRARLRRRPSKHVGSYFSALCLVGLAFVSSELSSRTRGRSFLTPRPTSEPMSGLSLYRVRV